MRGADSDLAEPFAMRDWEKTNSPQEGTEINDVLVTLSNISTSDTDPLVQTDAQVGRAQPGGNGPVG